MNEPAMPRRKKCPELAYKAHEFIAGESTQHSLNASVNNRARVSKIFHTFSLLIASLSKFISLFLCKNLEAL